MKTLTLELKTKRKLDTFADGLSNNKAIRKLLDNASVVDTVECKKEYYNVKVDDDLLDKIKKCKRYSNESHSDVIDRLLDEYQD